MRNIGNLLNWINDSGLENFTKMNRTLWAVFLLEVITLNSFAASYPRVDADLAAYDQRVAAMITEFNKTPSDPRDKRWVQAKIEFMFNVDQYMRAQWNLPLDHQYTQEESNYFTSQFLILNETIDASNTADLKKLLRYYPWFTISVFGANTDIQAWIIVQHADLDPAFQKDVLLLLEGLYPKGETSPTHYGYLFDRIAASYLDLSKRTLQRYGTQVTCTGPGIAVPIPMEDPERVDARRAQLGMGPLQDYLDLFKDICH